LKLIVKSFKLTPFNEESDLLSMKLLEQSDEDWAELDLDLDPREGNGGKLLEKMLEIAGNKLTTWMSREGKDDSYKFVGVEAPGASTIIGEGSVAGVETLLAPKPTPLIRVRLVKVEGNEKYRVIHEFKPSRESIVYEGAILVKDPKLDYDLILVETPEDTRILLPHELVLPPLKLSTETSKRKRRRKPSKTSKASKTKRKKSSRKRRKRGRRR